MKQLNYSFENKHPMSNIASLFDASKLTKEKKIINDITGLEIFHKRLVNKENKTADFFDDYNFR